MYDFFEEFYDMLHDCASSDESQAPLACGENLTRLGPQKIGGSRAVLDTRLPWYTSGFE